MEFDADAELLGSETAFIGSSKGTGCLTEEGLAAADPVPVLMLERTFSGSPFKACSLRSAIDAPPRILRTGMSTFNSFTNHDRTSTATRESRPCSMTGVYGSSSPSVICRITDNLAMKDAVRQS